MMSTREGLMEKWIDIDRGREGVKNPGNFVDVICTWPQTKAGRQSLMQRQEVTFAEPHKDPRSVLI